MADQDILALDLMCKAMEATSRRMRRAQCAFVFDKYVTHGSPDDPVRELDEEAAIVRATAAEHELAKLRNALTAILAMPESGNAHAIAKAALAQEGP